ncbi:hypothetical protein J6590_010061 [Homalodisca vitripennis]|nr:hypothetical protein J6590_010061 [Homalodisca vitripennis]
MDELPILYQVDGDPSAVTRNSQAMNNQVPGYHRKNQGSGADLSQLRHRPGHLTPDLSLQTRTQTSHHCSRPATPLPTTKTSTAFLVGTGQQQSNSNGLPVTNDRVEFMRPTSPLEVNALRMPIRSQDNCLCLSITTAYSPHVADCGNHRSHRSRKSRLRTYVIMVLEFHTWPIAPGSGYDTILFYGFHCVSSLIALCDLSKAFDIGRLLIRELDRSPPVLAVERKWYLDEVLRGERPVTARVGTQVFILAPLIFTIRVDLTRQVMSAQDAFFYLRDFVSLLSGWVNTHSGENVLTNLLYQSTLKQRRAWLLLGWVTIERSYPCKQPTNPAY